MGFGAIYAVTWFGNVNEAIGWGAIYPATADGSFLTVDATAYKADSTTITADQTEF